MGPDLLDLYRGQESTSSPDGSTSGPLRVHICSSVSGKGVHIESASGQDDDDDDDDDDDHDDDDDDDDDHDHDHDDDGLP